MTDITEVHEGGAMTDTPDISKHLASVLEALEDEHDAFVLFSRSPDEHQRRHHKGHHEYADVLLRKYRAAIDAAISEDTCPTCGGSGTFGFDRNGSHSADEYCEYDCPTCHGTGSVKR